MTTQKGRVKTLAYGLKSFLGYLESQKRSANTMQSYRLDLINFFQYLTTELHVDPEKELLTTFNLNWIHSFAGSTKTDGQKSNTRRRKLITIRKWLQYLHKRNVLGNISVPVFASSEKVEKVPQILDFSAVKKWVLDLPEVEKIEIRNKVLFLLILETAATVENLSELRKEHLSLSASPSVYFHKGERTTKISEQLAGLLKKLMENSQGAVFKGYNRFGEMPDAMTSRGAEVMFKRVTRSFAEGGFTPRTLRHTVIVQELRAKKATGSKDYLSVLKWAGLKTAYSLRIYRPLLEPQAEAKA